jgi:DNA processing protein
MPTLDDLRARLYLLRVAEPPAPALHAYVAVHGPAETVTAIRAGTAPPAVLTEAIRPDADITADLRAVDSGVARLVTPEDPEWPRGRLDALNRPGSSAPLGLWVRGQAPLGEQVHTAVTITGARAATDYGRYVATDFGYQLAQADVTVVAGGAYGVESSAHTGALGAAGRTIVVLACGVDMVYPAGNATLFDQITTGGGLLVSEYPIGTRPSRERFVARARLLAGLSAATVVVEAGRRSGALAVARLADELHRRVYGVPGPITSPTSAGVHDLLRSRTATVATSADEIDYQVGLR